jgi:hypothetical protein
VNQTTIPLAGRVPVVTGASRGVAIGLGEAGATVCVDAWPPLARRRPTTFVTKE